MENGPASRLKTRRDEESDEELPDVEPPHPKEELSSNAHHVELDRRHRKASPQLILLSPEEKELQFALNVSLTIDRLPTIAIRILAGLLTPKIYR